MNTSVMTAQRNCWQSSWMPYVVCFSAALFATYEFIQMHMFSAINTDIMRVYQLNAEQLGQLSAVYLWANVIFLFPAGVVLDRISVKKLILSAMTICVIGTMLFATVEHYWMAYLSRFVTGVGSAFCILSCMRLASRWFPAERMALITGLIITIAMLGGVFAQTPMAKLTEALGWRQALMVDGFIGIAIMLVIAVFVKDYPVGNESQQNEQREQLSKLGFWQSLSQSYFNRQNWLAAIYTSTMNMPVIVLGAVWGTLYLTQVHQLSATEAASINSMIFIGTIFGGPAMGWISDKIHLRKLPMLTGTVLCLSAIGVLLNVSDPSITLLTVIFFALGFFSSTQVLSYPLVSESNTPLLTATCISVISIITQGGGALYQPTFGKLLEKNWDGTFLQGVHWYNAGNFHDAFLMLLIGFCVAFVAALFIRETHCQQHS